MSQPTAPGSEQPDAVEAEPGAEAPEPAPLNRAERRAKAKKAEPTHVGPRGDTGQGSRGTRPHTKRPRG
ncbi:hypothetical protein ACU61A_27130 [Pseudonocardia sichuanensis]|uniref:Uncharacterized protein n=1 Tax=Pseudonocardia kunmingensis TaxID=630975 RepID=A0A543E403_9PSEU|nr:hypothetical protein [Pseudonocardia kunmingensis]TQM16334.1 hypothetical protein FB558_3144 [Pseudonocardia kunmingensis]